MEKLFFKMIGEYNTYSILSDLEKMKIRRGKGNENDLIKYEAFVEMSLKVLEDLSTIINIPLYHYVRKCNLHGYQIVYDRISTEEDE